MGAFAPIRVVSKAGTADYVHDNGRPYLTLTAALAAAQSGELVLVGPGTYNEAISIPAGVSVRGASTGAVTIQKLLVTADTDLVTLGENCRLEDVTLKLTSAEHHTLRGVVFPGTTSATSKLRTAVVTVDNSTAGAGGTSNVYGIHSHGTGVPSGSTDAVRAVTVQAFSAGVGNKRGLLLDTAVHAFRVRDVNFRVTNAGGAGSYTGVESALAGAVFTGRALSLDGASSDLLPTSGAGNIVIGPADLVHSTSGGLAFTSLNQLPNLLFSDDGSLPSNATRYMRPGTGAVTATEVKIKLSQKCIVQNLQIRAITGPGVGKTDVVTVRKNGIDTTLTASLAGAATSVANMVNAVSCVVGDDLSVKIVTDVATGTTDLLVTLEYF